MKDYYLQLVHGRKKGFIAFVCKSLLGMCSLVFGGVVQMRYGLYRSGILPARALPKPVVSIGNITWGGTGKTPMVLLVARYLQGLGKVPVVLTRGYHSPKGKICESDEVLMMKRSLPDLRIRPGANRYQSGREYLQNNSCDCFILDDGFQHLKLKRDLDIVLIDATNPWGQGYFIPRGVMREPLWHLKRADMIVLTKTNLAERDIHELKTYFRRFNFHAPIVTSEIHAVNLQSVEDDNVFAIKDFFGKKVILLSGIANPKPFEKLVEQEKLEILKHFIFADHHPFSEQDIQSVLQFSKERSEVILLTTAKDWSRLKHFAALIQSSGVKILIFQVDYVLTEGKEEFFERIATVIQC